MTSLGLVGIADKGTYNAEATYNKGQFVLYDGSTWLALKDNLNGVTPAEGENWKYLARGFAAELLSLVTAIDSQGLSGSQGGQVNAQSLIDVLADKVANQLIAKSMMSNVQVNDAEKVPTSALAYAMQQSIETLNSKTGELGSTSITVYGNYCKATKKNGFVFVSGSSADKLLTASTYNDITTLPEGFRPKHNFYFTAGSMGGGIEIFGILYTSGILSLYPVTATKYWIYSFMFPC